MKANLSWAWLMLTWCLISLLNVPELSAEVRMDKLYLQVKYSRKIGIQAYSTASSHRLYEVKQSQLTGFIDTVTWELNRDISADLKWRNQHASDCK